MILNIEIIGRRIRELRLQNNLSQAKLAEEIDMSETYISNIENATKQASLNALVLISRTLGVTLDSILYGNQENDLSEYEPEIALLLTDCTSYEKRVIYEVALATKISLIENRELINR